MRPRVILIILGALLAARAGLGAGLPPAAAQTTNPTYIVTDLGTLPNSTESQAYGINAGGQVVGQVDGGRAAFRWDPAMPNGTSGTMANLGTLRGPEPSGGASAYGINAAGQAVGSAGYNATNLRHAFRTAPNSPINPVTDDLGALIQCTRSEAHAINASGQVIGWAQGCSSDTGCSPYYQTAILWSGTTATCISGRYASVAYGINASGQIAGELGANGTLWQPDGGTWRPVTIDTNIWPWAINDYGQVIINSKNSAEPRPRLWTPSTPNGDTGVFTYLALPGQTGNHRVGGINNQGQVVGESGDRAFLWTPDTPNGTVGTIVDLNTLIPTGSGWTLTDAQAINAAGQIVGTMKRNGLAHAFLLTPDATPPTTTAAVSPLPNAAGWHTGTVTVSLTATDGAGSGVKEIRYSAVGAQPIGITTVPGASAQLSITAEGQTTLTYFARDLFGNAEQPKSLTIKVDRTLPVITASATAGGSPYTAGTWTNKDVTISFTCTDALSGVATTSPPRTIGAEGENQRAGGTCTDVAGNSSTTSYTGINIDKTAPEVTCGAPDGQWHSEDVRIACKAGDSRSGPRDPADANFALATNVPAGTESANARTDSRTVCDRAGNCTMAGPVGFNMVDKKGPAIGIMAPADGASYPLGTEVAAAYTCGDGGSGVASCAGTVANGALIDTKSLGAKTFSVIATDHVGNRASRQITYTVVDKRPMSSR